MERGGFPKRPPKRRAVSWWQHGPADRSENVFSRPQIRVDQSNLAVPFWNICGPVVIKQLRCRNVNWGKSVR
jgi:hypothetical protein